MITFTRAQIAGVDPKPEVYSLSAGDRLRHLRQAIVFVILVTVVVVLVHQLPEFRATLSQVHAAQLASSHRPVLKPLP
ncbi:MAG: hypothetical protein ACYDHP_05510 [Ferrimicrobium sp.]